MPKCNFNKVAGNFTEIALRHWCSPVNLLHIFRTPVSNNTSGRPFLYPVGLGVNFTNLAGGKQRVKEWLLPTY